jgi:hypothetical protein
MQAAMPPVGQKMVEALARRPFEPFWIVTHDGRKFLVHRLLQAGLNSRRVVYQPDDAVSVWLNLDEVKGIYSAAPQTEVD